MIPRPVDALQLPTIGAIDSNGRERGLVIVSRIGAPPQTIVIAGCHNRGSNRDIQTGCAPFGTIGRAVIVNREKIRDATSFLNVAIHIHHARVGRRVPIIPSVLRGAVTGIMGGLEGERVTCSHRRAKGDGEHQNDAEHGTKDFLHVGILLVVWVFMNLRNTIHGDQPNEVAPLYIFIATEDICP